VDGCAHAEPTHQTNAAAAVHAKVYLDASFGSAARKLDAVEEALAS
jgi:hypothetical protein